jgi:hypothetical protein
MNDLDSLLREDASQPLADGGFTPRVMAALPRARSAPAWLRPTLVFGSAALGSVLAAAFAPKLESPWLGIMDYITSGAISSAALTTLTVGVVLLVSAMVLVLDAE